jgi:hypothetical protein
MALRYEYGRRRRTQYVLGDIKQQARAHTSMPLLGAFGLATGGGKAEMTSTGPLGAKITLVHL